MADRQLLPKLSCKRVEFIPDVSADLSRQPWSSISPAVLVRVDESNPPQPQSIAWNAPNPGAAQFHTYLSACYTETQLLIAFRCADLDIWGTYAQRDEPLYEEEVVEAFLCPTGDLRHYYEFEVSPRNVVFDAKVYSPDLHRGTMQVDASWDCGGLQTAAYVEGEVHTTHPHDRGRGRNRGRGRLSADAESWWSVEMAIPFAAFPEVNPPGPGDVWRANFYRIDRADPPEFTAWSPTLEIPPNFHVPGRFGYLEFE